MKEKEIKNSNKTVPPSFEPDTHNFNKNNEQKNKSNHSNDKKSN